MKRYDCTMHDKRGAFGLCMEARSEGLFVPFTKVEQLQAKIFGLLEERNGTGIAINNAIRSGILPDKHPLRSRLVLLANHHKREQELTRLLAESLDVNKALGFLIENSSNPGKTKALDILGAHVAECERILKSKLPDHPVQPLEMEPKGWQIVPFEPTKGMLDEFDAIVDFGAEDSADAWGRMLAAAPKPEPTKGLTITEDMEFELIAALQSIVNGFSDNPAHDAEALLKRITGEVPWTGDSFQLPTRQGGELCATASPSSSPD